ncbi:MAG: tetratricopeptide repeat protein [Deltaproteobacteria bacterium]|nr:tetratricopeptide repeat protein [Deltaproteobacteria bacterium]
MVHLPTDKAAALAEKAHLAFVAEQFEQAEALFTESSTLLRSHVVKSKAPDEDAARTWVAAHCGAASAARAQGGYARAEKRLNEAEAFVLRTYGAKDAVYANVLNERGILRKYQGRFKEAEAEYKKCKPLIAKGFGKDSESMSVLLHNLGGIAHAQGHWKRAEAYAREGLRLRQSLPKPDAVAVAADQSALAAILDVAGNHDEAATLLAEALATFKKKLGPRSFEVGVTMETLGNLHYRIHDLPKADKLLTAALEIQQERLGAGHPELAFALHNLAVVRIDRGQPEDARPLLQEALATFKKTFGPKHANTLVVKDRLESLGKAAAPLKKAAPIPTKKPQRKTTKTAAKSKKAR